MLVTHEIRIMPKLQSHISQKDRYMPLSLNTFFKKFPILFAVLMFVLEFAVNTQPIQAQIVTIYRVDMNSTAATPDGSSWANAYVTLQDALAVATNGAEVWVANGTYYPDEGAGAVDNNRTRSTYLLIAGVEIYGGFAGIGTNETLRSERDPATNVTILSGDLAQDDSGFTNNGENAHHVVTGGGTDATAILDGFTITGGNANSSFPYNYGGGIYNNNGSPTLTNVIISGNSAQYGGGIYHNASSSMLRNVTISDNSATESGGGMRNFNGNVTLTNATISGNSARFGGGIANSFNSDDTLTNVIISGNSATGLGGGIYNDSSSPTLTNVTISGNSATDLGGVTNLGGGIFNSSSSPIIQNSIIWGNFASNGGNQIFTSSGTPTLTYTLVEGGIIGLGTDNGGNIAGNPLFTNAIPAASAPTTTGDYSIQGNSPVIDAANSDLITAMLDRASNDRFADDLGVLDTGNNSTQDSVVDMGAYEFQGISSAQTIYVDLNNVSGTENGISWATAFVTLQDALAVASRDEIWVADGTYYPDEGGSALNNDRTSTYQLIAEEVIYGGFAGIGTNETLLSERDPATNVTILSGDLAQDDSGFTNNGENAYHVVTGGGADATAILDGFTITAGNANGGSFPNDSGGGIYNLDSSPMLTNVTISGNSASAGGGIYNRDSSPTLTNVTINGNSAIIGGGMQNFINGNPTLTNVTISGNSAGFGGGIYNRDASNPTLTNVTISGNSATDFGGGINNRDASNPIIQNSIIWGNSSGTGGDQVFNNASTITLTYTLVGGSGVVNIGGGSVTDGGGNVSGDPLFTSVIPPASAPTTAGDYSIKAYSPAIDAANSDLITEMLDIVGNDRFFDDIGITNTGNNSTQDSVVDMGAYEFQGISPIRIYVDLTNVSGTEDGASWATAFVTLQDALAVATSGAEVWVADGTYYPDEGGSALDNDRTSTYQLMSEVGIYGGFAGIGTNETLRAERDIATNVTILSGDLAKNDSGSVNNSENAYHVVIGDGTNATAILDGFTITAGNANSAGIPNNRGGGIYNSNGSPTLTNLNISGNSADSGGGIFNIASSNPMLTNVTISGNSAEFGGGGIINLDSSNPTLTNVTISGNSAAVGGGVRNWNSSNPIIQNSIVWGNSAVTSGSQIANDASTLTLTYTLVEGGIAGIANTNGGSVINSGGNIDGDPLFTNAIPAANAPNTAGDYSIQLNSPAIDAANSDLIAEMLDLIGNDRFFDDPGITDTGNNSTQDSVVDMGAYEFQDICAFYEAVGFSPYTLGTVNAILADDVITAIECANANATADTINLNGQTVTFSNSYANYSGTTALPSITSNITIQNGTIERVGTNNFRFLYVTSSSTLTLNNVTLNNGKLIGGTFGGALYGIQNSTLLINDSTFTNNRAGFGGAVNSRGASTITNSQFTENFAGSWGGALMIDTPAVTTVRNSVFQANNANLNGGAIFSDGHYNIVNSLITGNTASTGAGIYSRLPDNSYLTNSTIASNAASGQAGGFYLSGGMVTIANSIIYDNSSGLSSADIYRESGTVDISYSIYGAVSGINNGGNNSTSNPLFTASNLASNAPVVGGDYTIQPASPAIEGGNNNADPDGASSLPIISDASWTDLAGSGRIFGLSVDVGAFEYRSVDVNNDGLVSPEDAIFVINRDANDDLSADVDGDGDVDQDDIDAVMSALGTTP